jgi:hypothetical protein
LKRTLEDGARTFYETDYGPRSMERQIAAMLAG